MFILTATSNIDCWAAAPASLFCNRFCPTNTQCLDSIIPYSIGFQCSCQASPRMSSGSFPLSTTTNHTTLHSIVWAISKLRTPALFHKHHELDWLRGTNPELGVLIYALFWASHSISSKVINLSYAPNPEESELSSLYKLGKEPVHPPLPFCLAKW